MQVSAGGGTEPVWGRDSRQLYYKHGNEVITATVATAPSFSVVDRKKVFASSVIESSAIHANYDVGPKGELLMVMRSGPEAQVIVVHNWAKEVRERLRRGRN